MEPNNIIVADNGSVIELTTKHHQDARRVSPPARCSWTAAAWARWAPWCCGDRKLLAEDGMVVVVLPMSSHDRQLLCPPEIVTRGFVYVKESEELLEESAPRGHRDGGRHVRQEAPGRGRRMPRRPLGGEQLSLQAHKAQPHDHPHGHEAVRLRYGKRPAHRAGLFDCQKTCPVTSIGGKDSVKGNRQGSLSRSITRRSDQNRKIKYCFLFCDFASACQKSPFGLF